MSSSKTNHPIVIPAKAGIQNRGIGELDSRFRGNDDRVVSFSTTSLFFWYQKYKRDLPWRRNPTPYFVWVSEIMLQQTQVQTVLPYYDRFMRRFPTLKSLAQAQEEAVLAHWSGLGYYSRARNLHKAAKIVQEKYNGKFPQTKEEILELPGIGPYTVGAILSIAFHKAVPLVDGNVKRILSRFFLNNSENNLWKIAGELVLDAHSKKIDPSDHNQAMMELGALVCLPEKPLCIECPLKDSCAAKKKNLQYLYPLKQKKNETVHQSYALFVISKGDELLLRQRSKNERWFKNMWEFPMISLESAEGDGFVRDFAASRKKVLDSLGLRCLTSPREAGTRSFEGQSKTFFRRLGRAGANKIISLSRFLEKEFKKKTGYSIRTNQIYPSFSHSITHHRLKIWPLQCTLISRNEKIKEDGYSWIEKNKIRELSSSSILKKALGQLTSP